MIYYVSNNGNGKSTDLNNPGNIYDTISNLNDNDEVICLYGEYILSSTINIINKSKSNHIIIRGLNFKNRPIFNFCKQKSAKLANGVNLVGNNITLQDIIICNAGYKGLDIYGENCLINRVETSFNQDSGLQIQRGQLNIIKDCDSHHNFGYKNDFTIANFGFSSDGFSDKLHSGLGNTFINCRAWSNSDDGFDFFGRENNSSENPSKLINCWSFFNGRSKWNLEKHPRYEIDKDWLDRFKEEQVMYGRWHQYIKVQLNNFPAFGNGNGFKLSGANKFNNIEVDNCIAMGNKWKGFDQNSNTGNMNIKNCIAYKNKSHNFGFGEKIDKKSKLTFTNCLSSKGTNYISWRIKNVDYINSNFNINNNLDLKFNIYDLMQPRQSDGSLPSISINKNNNLN